MEKLNGTVSEGQIFKSLEKVSDLIYYDGPLLSHYTNDFGDNYLFYWVDVDNQYNRWLIFRISGIQLSAYLDMEKSLLDTISNIPDKYLYSVDIDDDLNYSNILLIQLENIPESYLPKSASYYTFKPRSINVSSPEVLGKYQTGLLQASFKNSHTVGYGTIYLDVLSPALHHINEMTNGMGISYYNLKKSESDKGLGHRSKVNRSHVLSNSQFEVAGFYPGSFILLLRPINRQMYFEGLPTEVDDYCNFFLSFIEASSDYEKLLTFVNILDNNAITHYEKLLKNIQNFKLTLNLTWANPRSKVRKTNKIDYHIAPQILENITKLEYENPSELKLTGRFVAINLKTKHYVFKSHDEENIESTGYFDELLKDGVLLLKFNQDYDVTIARVESKQTGNKKPKIKDILIAFYQVK